MIAAAPTLIELGAFVTSVASAIVLVITALKVQSTQSAVKQVRHEVTTLNGKTIAVLADEDESRRIYAKPPDLRTPGDDAHIANVPPPS